MPKSILVYVGGEQASTYPKTEEEQRDAVTTLVSAVIKLQNLHSSALTPWGEMLRLRHGLIDLPLSAPIQESRYKYLECLRSTGTGCS